MINRVKGILALISVMLIAIALGTLTMMLTHLDYLGILVSFAVSFFGTTEVLLRFFFKSKY